MSAAEGPVVEPPGRARALVIVPTYNERDTVDEMARRLFDAAGDDVELLVVDDASPDGTADLVAELAQGPHPIHLMRRSHKLGLGTAYVAGFRWGLERGHWAMVEMDADLSHDPAEVPSLLGALRESELAIGSRYVPGGVIPNWGLLRRGLSYGGNLFARWWLALRVRDSTSGFRAYRSSVLAGLDLARVRAEGYGFQIEMTRRVRLAGGRVAEIPITFVDRTQGKSKMSRNIILEALVSVALWGVHDFFARRRKPRRSDAPVVVHAHAAPQPAEPELPSDC